MMIRKHIFLRILFGAYIVIGLVFIGTGVVEVASAALPHRGDEEIDIEIRVQERTWKWDPSAFTVPRGALVRLHISNEDRFDHGFAIREYHIDHRLPAGETTTVDFVADRTGEFEFLCSVYCGAGHFGQKGIMTVTEADGSRVAAESRGDQQAGGALDHGHGDSPTAAAAPATDDRALQQTDLPLRTLADRVDRLPHVMVDGVKQFELTAEAFLWDYGDGTVIESWGYNGQLPGPEIRVTEGDRVRIAFTNRLPVATTVHWHGVDLPNRMDGVPHYTQDPVEPGGSFVYEFTANPAGTRFYHTHGSHHGDEAEQMDMGLHGPLVIEPRDFVRPDVDVTWMLTERISDGIFPIDGAIYPHVEPIRVREGDTVRVRLINAGSSTFHPMHLHGHQFRIVATDGNPVPEAAQLVRNTLPVLPGESYDIEFVANNPGIWLFHCHELQHAGAGMIGLVVYEGYEIGGYAEDQANGSGTGDGS